MDVPVTYMQKIPMVVQPAYCDVCNVQCDTLAVLDIHKSGHKHRKNMNRWRVRAFAGVIPIGAREHMEVKRR